jgi:hypothetical protein
MSYFSSLYKAQAQRSSASALRAGDEARAKALLFARRYCSLNKERNDTIGAMKDRLPEGECVYLRTLSGAPLKARARALSQSGWSLAAIAEAFDPPRQRSSVRAWVLSNVPAPDSQPPLPPSPSSSLSSSSSIIARESSVSHLPRRRVPRRVFDPKNPRISAAQKKKISTLAPLARRYRARTAPGGTYARANAELTDLCKNLYYSGASVRELSLAAGVTYRAMARRLGR